MDGHRPTYDELVAQNKALEAQVARLTAQVETLMKQLEQQTRAGKRQAAPFSKGPPKPAPKRPGRKPGDGYGAHQRRAVPQQIDETCDAPLPPACPHCGGRHFADEQVRQQHQIEIPRTVIRRRFDIHCGRCRNCGKRVQGRHALQTSDALGAAAVQLGPNLHAAIAIMNKELGLPHGKVRRLLGVLYDLTIARSTSVRSMLRTAKKAAPARQEIVREIQKAKRLKVDETGWKQSGWLKWLHVFVSRRAVLYQIGGRDREVLQSLIGLDYRGTLIHDGYAAYAAFRRATHQQCLAHLLKRCRDLLETAVAGAVRFPRAVQDLLRRSLAVRDRYAAGRLTRVGLRGLATKFTHELETLVAPVKRHTGNERFAKFLEGHLDEVFTFLRDPDGTSATNNESEFELRFNVIARKLSGGNRSPAGIAAQETLPSIIRTCRKLTRDPFEYLTQTLTSPTPIPLYTGQGR